MTSRPNWKLYTYSVLMAFTCNSDAVAAVIALACGSEDSRAQVYVIDEVEKKVVVGGDTLPAFRVDDAKISFYRVMRLPGGPPDDLLLNRGRIWVYEIDRYTREYKITVTYADGGAGSANQYVAVRDFLFNGEPQEVLPIKPIIARGVCKPAERKF